MNICNKKNIHGLKATVMMVVFQISMGGMNVLYKLAAQNGMHVRIMVAYRLLFGAATILPLALYLERKNRPKLTRHFFFQAFLCSLFGGFMAPNLYGQGLVMTSATFATATINLITPLNITIATLLRLEKFELKSMAGKAKFIGTLTSICGAMLITFYKGKQINIIHWSSHHFSLLDHDLHTTSSHSIPINHILGHIFAICSNISAAISLIIQVKMNQKYSCHYSSTALISVMGSLQAVIFAVCMERRWSLWKLGWNIRLLAVAYSGIVASGIMIIVTMWCVKMRGPLFVSAFSPLLFIFVAIVGSLFLNEILHTGSVIGTVVIICGLYLVIWGKSKETRGFSDIALSEEAERSRRSLLTKGVAFDTLLTADINALDGVQDAEEGISSSNSTNASTLHNVEVFVG